MTLDQFKPALEDASTLLSVLAAEFPDQIGDDLLAHLDHCLKNPLSLKLLHEALEKQKKPGVKKVG